MKLQWYTEALARAARKPRSFRFKAVILLIGGSVFVFVVPALLFLAAASLEKNVIAPNAQILEIAFSALLVMTGLLVWLWTVTTQIDTGRGTPVPLAPTQKLIVTGPYRYCRNPMQLGAMLYYWGLGTYFGSVGIGVMMLLFILVIGNFYHKVFEERELLRRFGKPYEHYRATTPFLIPKWRR